MHVQKDIKTAKNLFSRQRNAHKQWNEGLLCHLKLSCNADSIQISWLVHIDRSSGVVVLVVSWATKFCLFRARATKTSTISKQKGTLFGVPLVLRPGRFELLTLRSAIWCSIQLSYDLILRSDGDLNPGYRYQYTSLAGKRLRPLGHRSNIQVTDGEGFEPPEACTSTVFKTASFDLSDIHP